MKFVSGCKIKEEQPPKKNRLNVMLRETLTPQLKQQLWDQIRSKSPNQFLLMQGKILNKLLSNNALFHEYFSKFYENHSQINSWYILAHENQNEIKQYVFKDLINKSYRQYRDDIIDRTAKKKFEEKQLFHDEKSIKNEKSNPSFHKIAVGNAKLKTSANNEFNFDRKEKSQQSLKMLESPQSEKKTEKSSMIEQDYHALFLKTLIACDGSKYIFYDFAKHMKGQEERIKYNDYIRNYSNFQKTKLRIGEFEEELLCDKNNDAKLRKTRSIFKHQPRTKNLSNIEDKMTERFYFHEAQSTNKENEFSKYTLSPIGTASKKRMMMQTQVAFRKFPSSVKKVKTVKNCKIHFMKKIRPFIQTLAN